jgi:hypothetical protein
MALGYCYWSAGVQGYRGIGALWYWGTVVLGYRGTGVLGHCVTGVLGYRGTGIEPQYASSIPCRPHITTDCRQRVQFVLPKISNVMWTHKLYIRMYRKVGLWD